MEGAGCTGSGGGEAGGFRPLPGQDENGVDLTLIRENLRLTPLERVRKAERLRRDVLRIHELTRGRATPKPA